MSTWIVLRFGPFPDAGLAFVGAGSTLDGLPPDERPDVIHVDTGLGRFDHHQPEVAAPDMCAARLVAEAYAPKDRALRRLVEYVIEVDNGRMPAEDRMHPFNVVALLAGLNTTHSNEQVAALFLPLLDAWYAAMCDQVAAEAVFEQHSIWFDSPWGPGVAIDHDIGPTQTLAYAHGAVLYLYQSDAGRKGFNAAADSTVDLTRIAQDVIARDPVGSWYLHPSKKMLLNGSKKNPNFVTSPLTLPDLIDFVRVR